MGEDNGDVLTNVDRRRQQSNTSRLCEYVTGVGIEDPKLFDILEEDQRRVRQKYGLPSIEYKLTNPSEYERKLRLLAKKHGIDIKAKSDCGSFFIGKNLLRGRRFSEDGMKAVGVDINRNEEEKDYLASLTTLEHELIHVLQGVLFKSMPIEVREYEAYVSNWNIAYLREYPDVLKTLFGLEVSGSVNHWYREMQNEGNNVVAEWKSAEYFLKKDGVLTK